MSQSCDRIIVSAKRARTMQEMIQILLDHGCPDATARLGDNSISEHYINAGGFGDIYEGWLKDGTKVAVKCARHCQQKAMDPQKLKDTARELYAWSKCRHPNILALVGLAQHRRQLAIVSPWMENGTLPQYISNHPEVDRLDLCLQVSSGLAYLHLSEMVHGDLKGSNVLISDTGIAKLTDFGNTTLKDHSVQFTTETSVSMSVRWAAPEILNGSLHSKQSDVYSLGMTILQTVTGRLPYKDKSDMSVLTEVFHKRFPPRNDFFIQIEGDKNSLWEVMVTCWNHDSSSRPDATEIQAQLAVLFRKTSGYRGPEYVLDPTRLESPLDGIQSLDFMIASIGHIPPSLDSTTDIFASDFILNLIPDPTPRTRTSSIADSYSTAEHSCERKILIIGSDYHPRGRRTINQFTYASNFAPLYATHNDKNELRSIFQMRGYSVDTLVDHDFDREEMLGGVARFLASAQRGDVRVIIFTGHAVRLEDERTSAIVPPRCLSRFDTISANAWNDNIRDHVRPGVVVLSIFAASFASDLGQQSVNIADLIFSTEVLEMPSPENPIFVTFSSSGSSEEAYESSIGPNREHSRDHFLWALALTARNPQIQTWGAFLNTLLINFNYARSMGSLAAEEETGTSARDWLFQNPQNPVLTTSHSQLPAFDLIFPALNL